MANVLRLHFNGIPSSVSQQFDCNQEEGPAGYTIGSLSERANRGPELSRILGSAASVFGCQIALVAKQGSRAIVIIACVFVITSIVNDLG
jgi:hypothetical protein